MVIKRAVCACACRGSIVSIGGVKKMGSPDGYENGGRGVPLDTLVPAGVLQRVEPVGVQEQRNQEPEQTATGNEFPVMLTEIVGPDGNSSLSPFFSKYLEIL